MVSMGSWMRPGRRTRSSRRGSAPSRPCWRPARPRTPRSAPLSRGPSTHPTSPAPPSAPRNDLPSEACVLVTVGLFSRSRPVEWRPTSSRPGKRGQGPSLGVGSLPGSRGGPLEALSSPPLLQCLWGAGKRAGPSLWGEWPGLLLSIHSSFHPSLEGKDWLVGGFSPCLWEEGF